jgi:hypothetical protein
MDKVHKLSDSDFIVVLYGSNKEKGCKKPVVYGDDIWFHVYEK